MWDFKLDIFMLCPRRIYVNKAAWPQLIQSLKFDIISNTELFGVFIVICVYLDHSYTNKQLNIMLSLSGSFHCG